MKTEWKIFWASSALLSIILFSKVRNKKGGKNNPGNIRNSGGTPFLGETTKPGDTFKSFKDIWHGIRAMFVLLNTYRSKHGLKTVRQIISRYAPPSDNNPTDAYVKYVSKSMDIHPDAVVPVPLVPNMIKAMSEMEGRIKVTLADAQKTYLRFFL